MPDNTFRIKLAIKNIEVHQQIKRILQDISGYEIMAQSDDRRPDLLVFELTPDCDNDFRIIESLLTGNEVGDVFLTSPHADPAILMRAIRIGAKEYFSQPINEAEVKHALKKFKENHKTTEHSLPTRTGQIISVMGSKGGVGTTTVAVNLAVSLSKKPNNHSVALLDMNSLFGEIPLFLEISPKFHWGEITKNIERLDKTFLLNVMTTHSSGIYVLPSPGYLNGHHAPTPEIMNRLLNLMKKIFDYVIIDGGQSTDETTLKVFQMSHELLLISILSLPCLSNTGKILKSFVDLGFVSKDKIKFVINRYMKKNDITLEDAKSSVRHPVFWTIPNDYPTSMAAINQGTPLCDIAPKSVISKNIMNLSQALRPEQPRTEKKRWGFFKQMR